MSGLVPFFARVSLAGAISCSATHSLVVPLDVMKTRMQTDANVKGLSEAAGAVLASAKGRGPIRLLAFFNGLSATATGYFLQGAAKFGARAAAPMVASRRAQPGKLLTRRSCARARARSTAPARRDTGGYEALKHATFTRMRALPDGERLCAKLRLPVMCVSAAAAEFIATGLLCPLEVSPRPPPRTRVPKSGSPLARRRRPRCQVLPRPPPLLAHVVLRALSGTRRALARLRTVRALIPALATAVPRACTTRTRCCARALGR